MKEGKDCCNKPEKTEAFREACCNSAESIEAFGEACCNKSESIGAFDADCFNGIQETQAECCSHRTTDRTAKEYRDMINRLSRIEGQIRGIKKMVEEDAYCTDILIQVSAANAALNSFSRVLLSNHIKGCVTRDILAGKEETVDELVFTLQKLMK